MNPSDDYSVTFNFNLDKVLTGISTAALQTANKYIREQNTTDIIWKGGSADVPFYDQVTSNWQNVATVAISKK
jgi:hypothetical protein